MISNQIALLELSVLYANFGLSRLEELIPSLYKKEPHPQKKSFLPSLADLKQLISTFSFGFKSKMFSISFFVFFSLCNFVVTAYSQFLPFET
jgi:hypothetical protein